jgi:hypothetical protein
MLAQRVAAALVSLVPVRRRSRLSKNDNDGYHEHNEQHAESNRPHEGVPDMSDTAAISQPDATMPETPIESVPVQEKVTPERRAAARALSCCAMVAKLYRKYGGPFVPLPPPERHAAVAVAHPRRGNQIKRRLKWLG